MPRDTLPAAYTLPTDAGPADDALPPLFPISQLPSRPWMPKPRGKPISLATIYRWIIRGPRNSPPLRTLMVGGTRCTSDQWAAEFFRRVTDGPAPAHPTRTPSARARAQRRAAAELSAAGI